MSSLRISEVIEFLDGVKATDGDIKVQTITGFWVRTIPATGERVVVCAVGDGQALNEAWSEQGLVREPPRRG